MEYKPKRQEVCALYIHCFAHIVNLCVQEVSKQVEVVRNVMDLISYLVQLIKFSPKRATMLEILRMDISVNTGQTLGPSLCPTRWTVWHTSIESILSNYKLLLDTLEEVEKGKMSMLLKHTE